jgi:hypothetical protein
MFVVIKFSFIFIFLILDIEYEPANRQNLFYGYHPNATFSLTTNDNPRLVIYGHISLK